MTHDASAEVPPRLWARVLRWSLPPADRDWQSRELAELYRARLAKRGRPAARRWYRREVLGFLSVTYRSAVTRFAAGVWGGIVGGSMRDISRDVRYAARSLIRNPGFATVAIATIMLGIGANTLIFSVVDHVMFRPLPYPDPDGLVTVWPNAGMLRGELQIIQLDNRSFIDVGGYVTPDGFNLNTGNSSRRVQGSLVTPGVLRILGADPLLGRVFLDEETLAGSDGVVLITERLWNSEFGSDRDVIGSPLDIDGRTRTVIGVLPASLAFPDPTQDILVPLVMDPSDQGVLWGWGGHQAIARLSPGVTPEMAQEDLRGLESTMRTSNTLWTPIEGFRSQATVIPMRDAILGDTSATLYVLLGAVGLVLVVSCANVANLLLVRGLARQRDVALRGALGASRGRIVRQELVESLLIAIVGCLAALAVAQWALRGLVSLLPPEIPRAQEIGLDTRVIAVGVVSALFAGLLAGTLPAMRGARTDPGVILRESGRGSRGGSAQRRRLSDFMAVAQIVIAVLLVSGAGLLIRSFSALNRVDRGFDTTAILTARLTLAGEVFEEPAARLAFFDGVAAKARALPGVGAVSVGTRVPFGVPRAGIATFVDGVTSDPNDLPILYRVSVSDDYLGTLGIPLLEGRAFTSMDRAGAPLVTVVDETAAREFWPGESPIGRRIRYPWRGAPWIEVIGVVGGVADRNLAFGRDPVFYVPMAQNTPGAATIVIKAGATDGAVLDGLRAAVDEVNGTVPVSRIARLDRLVGASMAQARWTTVLLVMFAATTLLLGSVGVYGVVAYSVRARTQEIGVRMALGADSSRIRTAILRDGLKLVVPGVVVGLFLAVPGARLLAGLLFGISTFDPVTFASVPLVLTAAALMAVYAPARRATRVYPVEALRGD